MSDFLRLLTRSTSVAKTATHPKSPKPESTPENTTSSTSKKRKRKSSSKSGNGVTQTTSTLVPAQTVIVGKSDKKDKKKKRRKLEEEVQDGSPSVVLDAAEIRSILKRHKLKHTILATIGSRKVPAHEEAPIPKKDKKQKRRKEEATSEDKVEEQGKSSKLNQIYPAPVQTFEELRTSYNISKRLHENVLAQKYIQPTEVQMGSLPLLLNRSETIDQELEGCDVDLMTVAPTGSGKTLAYAIPAIDYMIRTKHEEGDAYEKGIRAIVLSPTRELADQIVNEFRKLLLGTGIKVTGMRKALIPKERRKAGGSKETEESSDEDDSEEDEDSDASDQEDGDPDESTTKSSTRGIAIKSEILVATPLLLLHALQLCPDLFPVSHVSRIILDEADVLLDNLFLSQTTSIISYLTSPSLQFTFWSATMPSSSETLAQDLISTHFSTHKSTRPRKLVRLIAGIKDSSLPTIRQTITYTASERGKLLALRQLFTTSLKTPCLIFLQTIPRAQALEAEIMYDLPTPNRIACLHSNLSETARSKIMDKFRQGEIWVLITTDLLSRGVDFRGVSLVINYDIPTSVASYIHRIGRTGRAGREGGQAVTYYTEEDVKYVRGIVQVMQKSGGEGLQGVQKWMLKSLPKTTKEEKKELKKKGVKERRVGSGTGGSEHGKEARRTRISTKSGYERRVEGRRKAAIEASKRKQTENKEDEDGSDDDDEWEGFE